MGAVGERVERIDMAFVIDPMSLSFSPKALDVRIWSCIREVIDSTERQFWSCKVSGCSANDMPVFVLYPCKVDAKSA